jgi:meso-butanediol dehydrogenase / (S,S)-butanediol dehydrogenase / diacetyl reductase
VAGIPQFGRVDDLSDAEWQRQLDVNLTGPFTVCRAALPHLRATRGCIVNVASIAGLQGQAYTAAYCASKGGLVALTRALAVELALDGVRVNCVCPAAVDTPLLAEVAHRIPPDADPRLLDRLQMLMPGLVTPGQVADAVAWLASDAAALVTGQALALDGGRSA